MIVSKAEKIEPIQTQMEQWSILSNTLNYIQYDRHLKNYQSLGISAVNKCRKTPCTKEEERDMLRVRFWSHAGHIKGRIFRCVQRNTEILSTTRFDENSDLSTTYLGKADKSSNNNKIKAEESFPISEQGYTMGKLLYGTEWQIILDTGTSKSSC